MCVGLDLAGVGHRPTGLAILRDGRLSRLGTLGDDEEVVRVVQRAGRHATVAINAPLTRPRGRCCLDDDCPCRQDPGTRSRALERDLARMGVPALATALIKVLARRGARIAMALRVAGFDPLEVYPFATLKLLGLPWRGKKTVGGRREIHRGLKRWVPGLDHPGASEHELDAVACALTARLWLQGRARLVGDADEGLMVVPKPRKKRSRPAEPVAAGRARVRKRRDRAVSSSAAPGRKHFGSYGTRATQNASEHAL